MYAKVLLAATAVVAQVAAFSMPSCWSDCFAQYEIKSEQCLCSDPLEEVVSCCIDNGCAASNMTSAATQYASWVSSYCNAHPFSPPPVTTTDITTIYTTECPVTESLSTYTTTSVVTTTTHVTSTAWSYVTKTTSTTQLTTCETGVSTYTSTYVTVKTPGYNSWATKSVAPVTAWSKGPAIPIPTYAPPQQQSWSASWSSSASSASASPSAKANATTPNAPWQSAPWSNAASAQTPILGAGVAVFAVMAFFL